jgi:hypothetical protein
MPPKVFMHSEQRLKLVDAVQKTLDKTIEREKAELDADDGEAALQRARAHAGPEHLAKALALCHWRHDRTLPVRAGAKGDRFVLLLRSKAWEITPEAIAQGFGRLVRLMDELEQA